MVSRFVAGLFAVAVLAPGIEAQSTDGSTPTRTTRSAPAAAPAHLRYVVAPTGNEVRYRVREQLVGVDLPNDAVGATRDVSGGIAFDAAGKLVPASSKFVVNVGTLRSDKDRRDGYVRGRILETSQFPTVELTPAAIMGLA